MNPLKRKKIFRRMLAEQGAEKEEVIVEEVKAEVKVEAAAVEEKPVVEEVVAEVKPTKKKK